MVTVTTSQGLLALITAATRMRADYPELADRIEKYFDYRKQNDLRCVQAITDAKGDRKLAPGQQADPDVYTRIVERRPDGIVIRGAKLHISSASVSHELVVMPTKNMKPGDEDYAVACAVPVNAPACASSTPVTPRASASRTSRSAASSTCPRGLIIFDDVFVPTSASSSTVRPSTRRPSRMLSGCGSASAAPRTWPSSPISSSAWPS